VRVALDQFVDFYLKASLLLLSLRLYAIQLGNFGFVASVLEFRARLDACPRTSLHC
jgi:hypothetical protein